MTTDNIIPTTIISNTDELTLSQADQDSIKLLERIDTYMQRYNELSELFQKGCINLSRANYASNRRYDSTYYDERGFMATSTIKISNSNIELKDATKRSKRQPDVEKVGAEEEANTEEKESILKNRSQKTLKHEQSIKEIKEDKNTHLDPIKMFGGLVPYQLRESQRNFKDLLPIVLELVELKKDLGILVDKLQLTQLQICLDQLTDMFFASLSYIDQNHDAIQLDVNDPKQTDPEHNPPSPQDFKANINELTSDIILKTKQILTIIDTLPGVGVSKKEQMEKVAQLQEELKEAELTKKEALQKKEELQEWVNELILQVAQGIAETRD